MLRRVFIKDSTRRLPFDAFQSERQIPAALSRNAVSNILVRHHRSSGVPRLRRDKQCTEAGGQCSDYLRRAEHSHWRPCGIGERYHAM